MSKFLWVSGHLAEVQRFINVPMRWCEQHPARERRELWVGAASKLVETSRRPADAFTDMNSPFARSNVAVEDGRAAHV